MDFLSAAEASAAAIAGTDTEAMLEAFADGVNAYVAEGPLPLEFGLLGYEPRDWSRAILNWQMSAQSRLTAWIGD